MSLENILRALEFSMKDKLEALDKPLLENQDVKHVLTTFFSEHQTRPELVSQIRSQSLMYGYLKLNLDEREELGRFKEKFPEYLLGKEGEYRNLHRSVTSSNVLQFIRTQRYVNQLLQMFDFYLENRNEGEIFCSGYLHDNKTFKKRFGGRGNNLYSMATRLFQGEGRFKRLLDLGTEINPKIMTYTDRKELFKVDAINHLSKIFKFYQKERENGELEGVVFNGWYVSHNKKLNKELRNLGARLVKNADRNLKNDGGFKKLLELGSENFPEISRYSTFKELMKVEIPCQILQMFEFFLHNNNLKSCLNTQYIVNDKKLKEQFGNQGMRLYMNIRNNFKKEGIDYFIQLASRERPEILKYWKYSPISKR